MSIPPQAEQACPAAMIAPHGPPLARQPIFVAKAISAMEGVFEAKSIEIQLEF